MIMTNIAFRQYETRMHVAMMVDAYRTHFDGTPFEPCETGNSFTRFMSQDPSKYEMVWVDDYFGMPAPMHPYAAIWHRIGMLSEKFGWNKLADYEIDRNWKHARQHGMKILGGDVPASAFVAAQLRWERNGWLRYEFKRSKRRSALAPFLRVAAIA